MPCTDIYCKHGKELLTRNPPSTLFSSINAIYAEPFSGRFGQRVLAETSLLRDSHRIDVVYSPDHLQRILASTKIPSNKDEKALYPIFVTSRLRFRHDLSHTDLPQEQLPNLLLGKFAPAKVLLIAVVPEIQLETYLALFPDPDPQSTDTLRFVTVRDLNIGIGRKRTIVMLLAQKWSMGSFFLVDDDIEEFWEYDRGLRNHVRVHPWRPLAFMQNVLKDTLFSQSDTAREARKRTLEDDNGAFMQAIQRSVDVKQFGQISRLLGKSIDSLAKDPEPLLALLPPEIQAECRSLLYGKDRLGQVALWNSHGKSYSTQLWDYQRKGPWTHIISTARQQVILYDTTCTAGIHPVSDAAFWEEPLPLDAWQGLIERVNKENRRDGEASVVARESGYKFSDSAHVRQQLMHGIGGALVYRFSFTPNEGMKSLVNVEVPDIYCDNESSEEEEEEGK